MRLFHASTSASTASASRRSRRGRDARVTASAQRLPRSPLAGAAVAARAKRLAPAATSTMPAMGAGHDPSAAMRCRPARDSRAPRSSSSRTPPSACWPAGGATVDPLGNPAIGTRSGVMKLDPVTLEIIGTRSRPSPRRWATLCSAPAARSTLRRRRISAPRSRRATASSSPIRAPSASPASSTSTAGRPIEAVGGLDAGRRGHHQPPLSLQRPVDAYARPAPDQARISTTGRSSATAGASSIPPMSAAAFRAASRRSNTEVFQEGLLLPADSSSCAAASRSNEDLRLSSPPTAGRRTRTSATSRRC